MISYPAAWKIPLCLYIYSLPSTVSSSLLQPYYWEIVDMDCEKDGEKHTLLSPFLPQIIKEPCSGFFCSSPALLQLFPPLITV